jgi:TolA-binding protein
MKKLSSASHMFFRRVIIGRKAGTLALMSLLTLIFVDFHEAATAQGRAATRPRSVEQAGGDQTPRSLGGSEGRAKVRSDSKVSVEQRTDNVTTKKKQGQSEREKRESGGRRLSQSEIQRVVGERNLSGALRKEISYAESVLKKLPRNSPQRPKILQRLIESYHNQSLLVFFQESRVYDRNWTRWDTGGRKGPEPRLDNTKSEEWTGKVVKRAQQMIDEYPKDREIDEAFFQVAYALDQLGKRKEAAAYYSQLVGRFPNSARIADAHFALGEFYFDATDFKKALTSFTEASKHTRSSIYAWAVYKTGWCHYNLQDYRNALGSFQSVVRMAPTVKRMTAEGRARLKEEALRDMVNPYADLQDIDGAERYFASVGGQKYFADLLTKLADLLREQGQYEKSIAVLRRFISRNPTDLTAADIQIQIVDTANLMADKKLMWAELQILLRNYNPDTPWGKRNASRPEYKDLAGRVHTVAINYPKQMHADAQKSQNRYLYGQAAMGYELYLAEFSGRPEAEEIRFLLGEIHYQQGKYDESRKVFWAMTTADKERKGRNFAKAAQYLLSAAYIPIEDKMKALRAQGAKLAETERPIDPGILEYLKVCQKIIEWFPTSASVRDCELDSAEVFLKHNHYAKAEQGLWLIAKKYPKGKEGKDAAGLLLFLASKDPKKLVMASKELSKIGEYRTGDIGKRLSAIDETNRFEQTLELEKSGDFRKAAEGFEQLARSNPKGAEADKAWYNAGLNYKKAGDATKAIAAFSRVYTDHPKASQAPDALLAVIEINDSQLKLDQVGTESQRFLQAYPNDKRAPVVRREACLVYAARNDVSGAQKTCGAIVKSGGSDVAFASKALAQVYRRTDRHADLIAVTDTHLIKLPVSGSEKIVFLAHAAEAERKLGRRGAVAGRENQIMGFYGRERGKISGEALAYVGKIEFDKNREILAKYSGTRLTARKTDGSDLQASITTKQALLQNLEKSYQKVIATGDAEWGVAAMVTIGGAYEVFANDLRNAPLPPGVTAEQGKPIKDQIAALAAKPAEKALAYYRQAADAVSKFGVYNEFSKRNAVALARLDPKAFRELQEWIPETVFVGSNWSDTGPASRALKLLGD